MEEKRDSAVREKNTDRRKMYVTDGVRKMTDLFIDTEPNGQSNALAALLS